MAIESWMHTYRDYLGVRSLFEVLAVWSNHHQSVCHRMAFADMGLRPSAGGIFPVVIDAGAVFGRPCLARNWCFYMIFIWHFLVCFVARKRPFWQRRNNNIDLAVLSEESSFLKTQKNNNNSEKQKSCIKKYLKFEIQHFFANAFQTTLPLEKGAISFQGRSLASLVAHRCATQSKSIV